MAKSLSSHAERSNKITHDAVCYLVERAGIIEDVKSGYRVSFRLSAGGSIIATRNQVHCQGKDRSVWVTEQE